MNDMENQSISRRGSSSGSENSFSGSSTELYQNDSSDSSSRMEWEKQKQALRRRTYGGKTISADLESNIATAKNKVDEQLKGWLIEIGKCEVEDRIHQEQWHDLKELCKNILALKVDAMTWMAARTLSQRLSAKMKEEHPPKYAAFLVKILFAFAEVCRWLEYKEYERTKDIDWHHPTAAFIAQHTVPLSPRSNSLNLSPPTKPQIQEVPIPPSPKQKSLSQTKGHEHPQPTQTQATTKEQPSSNPQTPTPIPKQSKVDKTEVIICRVCDQPLRKYLLDVHTPYCTEKAAIEEQLRDLDVKMRECADMMKTLAEEHVKVLKQMNADKSEDPEFRKKVREAKKKKAALMTLNFITEGAAKLQLQPHDNNTKKGTLEHEAEEEVMRKAVATADTLIDELEDVREENRKRFHGEAFMSLAKDADKLLNMKAKLFHEFLENQQQYETKLMQMGVKEEQSDSIVIHKTSIKDFEFLRPLTRGSFGRIFIARKTQTGDIYCIKCMPKEEMKKRNNLDRIQKEQDIMAHVNNDFIVSLYYSFQSKNNLYLVMEFCGGGDLYSLLDKFGGLDEKVARFYIAELIVALEYLHKMQIIHRDIKPDNVLIASNGHIKLTDFGLSKVVLCNENESLLQPKPSPTIMHSALDSSNGYDPNAYDIEVDLSNKNQTQEQGERRSRKAAYSYVGTPAYIAPEIILGSGHSYEVDWWSVGVVLFELIVGVPPFDSTEPEEVFEQILKRDIPWDAVVMSAEAADLIDQLTQIDPTQRLGYHGADEIKAHPFFKTMRWDQVMNSVPPFIPRIPTDDFVGYFRGTRPISMEDLVSTKEKCPGFGDCEACEEVKCADRVQGFSFRNVDVLSNKTASASPKKLREHVLSMEMKD
mmetsp:Transcript_5702/g.7974  ORF Transcript_5702/g.7974 Transcript_5702/m.7974 type:complete len:872 (-) Transcript_5702:25-2640(-)